MKRITRWHILLIGLIFFTISLMFLWRELIFGNTTSDKIPAAIASALSLFASTVYFIIFAYSFGKKHNVFLYDKKTKKEIDLENLTFERVCEFLDVYIGLVFHGKKSISISDLIDDGKFEHVPKQYQPLIIMRLLLIWMESDSKDKWKQLSLTDKKYVDAIEIILANCGEDVISSRIQYLRTSEDNAEIESFFLNKIDYLKVFILNFVKDNINEFN